MEFSKLKIELNPRMQPAQPLASGAPRAHGLAAAGAVLLAGCRLDMHIQPKYLPYEPTDFFADGRSERQPVRGNRRARPVAAG